MNEEFSCKKGKQVDNASWSGFYTANTLMGPQQMMAENNKLGSQNDNSEITAEINCLENHLNCLLVISSDMSTRLSSVISEENKIVHSDIKKKAPMQTQLGSKLFTLNMQAMQLRESLQDIIDRCKL